MRALAFYNENDPRAAAWLRELIAGGHIAPGVVDERSIADLEPHELEPYTQVHLFAGIGGWSLALRRAGWPDERPVWTGSCPCPPFSCAGKKKLCPECGGKPIPHPRQTGIFACVECAHKWYADGRHLWPEMLRLIAGKSPNANRQSPRPAVVFGEQVASEDGLVWLDGVCATLEDEGYATGAADLCAAGVGAPHIRQRLWWVAISAGLRRYGPAAGAEPAGRGVAARGGDAGWVAVADGGDAGAERLQRGGQQRFQSEDCGAGRGVADAAGERGAQHVGEPRGRGVAGPQHATERGGAGRLGDVRGEGLSPSKSSDLCGTGRRTKGGAARESGGARLSFSPQPSAFSPWSTFDLLPCLDGKTRRVEPGTFPLAHGVPGRVGLLRGYGNAIVPSVAAAFISPVMELLGGLGAWSLEQGGE